MARPLQLLVASVVLVALAGVEAQRRGAARGRGRGGGGGGAGAAAATAGADDLDVDAVLGSERALTALLRCVVARGDGPCSDQGKAVKAFVASAVETNCASCSESQQAAAEKVLRHLTTRRKSDWNKLVARYDPTGELRSRYRKHWEQRGVRI
ncbi:putative odorant-binding protein A10 [Schistocerca americana]|uniref:putative odorant-binding protein A10 n=1 Tax=Schistocerca americana TaxID=7009 RepID=UPI001F4F83CA|nr:putative odorant-binding protein A10 [Schistocerca americana]